MLLDWQPNKCHYIHKYLHGNLICHSSTTNEEHWKRVAAYFKAGGRKSKQVKNAAHLLKHAFELSMFPNTCRFGTMWKPCMSTCTTLLSSMIVTGTTHTPCQSSGTFTTGKLIAS
jgi:hypothetical protein